MQSACSELFGTDDITNLMNEANILIIITEIDGLSIICPLFSNAMLSI